MLHSSSTSPAWLDWGAHLCRCCTPHAAEPTPTSACSQDRVGHAGPCASSHDRVGHAGPCASSHGQTVHAGLCPAASPGSLRTDGARGWARAGSCIASMPGGGEPGWAGGDAACVACAWVSEVAGWMACSCAGARGSRQEARRQRLFEKLELTALLIPFAPSCTKAVASRAQAAGAGVGEGRRSGLDRCTRLPASLARSTRATPVETGAGQEM